jgi:excisionase family DNA binding protein
MTVKQAAQRLEVAPSTVYALCAAGLMPHHRVGLGRGVIRIDEADVRDYIEARRRVAATPPVPEVARLVAPVPDLLAEFEPGRRRG